MHNSPRLNLIQQSLRRQTRHAHNRIRRPMALCSLIQKLHPQRTPAPRHQVPAVERRIARVLDDVVAHVDDVARGRTGGPEADDDLVVRASDLREEAVRDAAAAAAAAAAGRGRLGTDLAGERDESAGGEEGRDGDLVVGRCFGWGVRGAESAGFVVVGVFRVGGHSDGIGDELFETGCRKMTKV